MAPSNHDDGTHARAALFVKRLRDVLMAMRDAGFELQEIVAAAEATAAEHRCALCGAPISPASASPNTATLPSAATPT